jgi:glycosyltransferase involved in cell wall biosynthesis
MSAPLVSIGLPVYNGGERIAGALDSILRQSFTDFEVVIVDNASTDDTGAICQDYARKDRRIRYFRNAANIGVNPNHDRVFAQARGKYFAWFADDVEYAPDAVGRCVAEIERASATPPVLVHPRCQIIRDGRPLPPTEQKSISSSSARPWRRLAAVLSNVGLVNQLYGLIRAEALRQTRLNGLYASSDYVLLAELAMQGEIREIPEVLIRRRIDSNRGTAAVHRDLQAWKAWLGAAGRRSLADVLPYRERLAFEYLRAAWHIPISAVDKCMCVASILPVHYERTSRVVRIGTRLLRPWRWRQWWQHRRCIRRHNSETCPAPNGTTVNHE